MDLEEIACQRVGSDLWVGRSGVVCLSPAFVSVKH